MKQVTIAPINTDVSRYAEQGYVVAERVLSLTEVELLRREIIRMCRGDLGQIEGLPPSLPTESDDQVIRKTLCVHFPHKVSQVIYDFLAHPAIVNVLTQIIGPDVKCMQSMLFIKAAGKPGQAWHQDEDFIPTRDRSLAGAWIALDDATIDNGCLWVIPGSHRRGILWPLRAQKSDAFDCSDEAYHFPYSDVDSVPVEVKAGSIVFFNGYLLHRSLPNRRRTGYRRALVNHYMSATSLLPWRNPVEGEYVSTHDYRDIVMVAGRDPYSYKGTEQLAFPHIRPNREGGCKWPEQEASNGNGKSS